MKNQCPICSLLNGRFIGGSNYCEKCNDTADVVTAYQRYSLYRSILLMIRVSYFVYPVLIVSQIVGLFKMQHVTFGNVVMVIFSNLLCGYNIYRWLRIDHVPFWGNWDKLEDMKNKIFVAKLAGHPNGWFRTEVSPI